MINALLRQAALAGALVAGLAASAAAMTVFDNGDFSGSQVGRFNGGSFWMYDDFTLSSATTIDGVFWRQHDQSVTYTSTDIRFYETSVSAANLVASFTLTATRTPNATGVLFGNYAGFDYEVSGLDLDLDAGTYFLGLHNNVAGGQTTWDETEGTAVTIPGRFQSTAADTPGGFMASEDSVFRILAESGPSEVPVPATLPLLAFAAAALGFVAKRRA